MVMVEADFMYGVIRKSLILATIAAIIAVQATTVQFAVAIVIGALITAINLRIVAWATKKMLDPDRGSNSPTGWSILLAAKLVVLISVIWVLITRVEVNAVGFAIGFSLFMPAIGWQMIVAKPEEQDSEEGQG